MELLNVEVTDVITVEDARMSVAEGLPNKWLRLYFHTKNSSGALADATLSILVYDASRAIRVPYTAGNLVKTATGKYYYDFLIPSVVVPGDWYASVTATIGSRTTVKNVHFPVQEV